MNFAQSISSITSAPLSTKAHQSWALSALHTDYAASSHAAQANPTSLTLDMTKEQIRKLFSNVDLSVSSYDTAWVAMVPSPNSPKSPCFPQCLGWLMDNQLSDGSWGLDHHNPAFPLLKDALSSTLACIVALKRWNVGEDYINKGLHFIESNIASAIDKNLPSPFGFDIIFPYMLECAKDLNINLSLKEKDLSSMFHERELELKRCGLKEREAYLAYISEGLGNVYDWNMVKKFQMNNGSVSNSPSATAAALIHHQNAACLDYLTSLLHKFGNAVYPLDLYARLSMVDALERLGIARHFREEIQNILDEIYRCWVQRDEQIFMDVLTCALAFRVLRINGYEVSSDPLAEITKEGTYTNSLQEPFKDVYVTLELYRASHIFYQEELAFEELHMRSSDIFRRMVSTASDKVMHKEVENAHKFTINGSLERISTRRNIEHYNVNNTRILKTAYRSSNISNEGYLRLAVEDFNTCQSIYCEELKGLERWVVENKLHKLKFARQRTAYCYFSVAATLSSPELSDARISWAKSGILTTLIDDFFDVGGSSDELVNLIQCVKKWNVNVDTDCCSENVRILFLTLKDAVTWIGETAFKRQERDVTSHVIQQWLDLMKSMLREAIWSRDAYVPTINEYMENAYVSVALGPVILPALYLLGPKLSEEIVESDEYQYLFKLMSTQCRLLNDTQSFKRESKEGKLNAVALHMSHGTSEIVEEEVVKDLKMVVKNQRRELMKLVMEAKGSNVPRACKDAFWHTCNVFNLFYATDDGFSGNMMIDIVKKVIYEPVSHPLVLVNGSEKHL